MAGAIQSIKNELGKAQKEYDEINRGTYLSGIICQGCTKLEKKRIKIK